MLWIALQPGLEPDVEPDLESGSEPNLEPGPIDLQTLAWHALSYTPRVTALEEAVLMEVSASVRLFGGLQALLKKLVREHTQRDQAPQPVLRGAPGHTALAALGRLRTGLPWRESSRLAVGDLPLACLSAARPHAAVLERLGCRTWDDLRQLPRDGVARRFGQPLLLALDQAYGEQAHSLVWLELPEVFDDSLELPALVEHAGALMFGVNHLLGRLRVWLLGRSQGLLGVQLRWSLDPRRDVARQGELTVRLSEASQDMAHVARLLAEHLAQVQLPAPAHTLGLRTLDTAPLSSASHSLLMDERQRGDSLAQLVERLSARLGPERVLRWQPQARHVPERMQRWVAAQAAQGSGGSKGTSGGQTKGDRTQGTPSPGQPAALMPSWLLDEPLPLPMQGERPCYEGALTLLVGPQRQETTGWAGRGKAQPGSSTALAEAPVMRDYFIARSQQAGLLWIFRQRSGGGDHGPTGWYLHGIFA